jgi:hypothetical protein
MRRRQLAVLLSALGLVIATPGGNAVASATVDLVISHVAVHCHVWTRGTKTLGAATKLTVRTGTRVVIRPNCPMDFDFAQTKGPRLALGPTRTYAGSTRVLVFRKTGVYRLTATNVQTPEERGLATLGEPNVLTLTVIVTR